MTYLKQFKKEIKNNFGDPGSLDELAFTVINVINSQVDRKGKPIKVVGFAWDINYRESVSNSHNAPINGVRNWGGREKLEDGSPAPQGYPGWSGRVWVRYANRVDTSGSDPFEATLTYPGTGGWGSYNGPFERIAHVHYERYGNVASKFPKNAYPEPQVYSWDYRFFADDWPGVKDWWEKQQIVAVLQSKDLVQHHSFQWMDSEIERKDSDFINKTNQLT